MSSRRQRLVAPRLAIVGALMAGTAACAGAHAVSRDQWPPPLRYITDSTGATRQAVNIGFNLVDIPPVVGALNSVPPGARALVWLGQYEKRTCTWELSDADVRSLVRLEGNDPRVAGFYLADEPHVDACPAAPRQLAARSALVHRLAPRAFTYAVIEDGDNHPGEYAAFRGTVDVIGLDPYPCTFAHGCRYGEIDAAVRRARASGVTRIWGVVQAFQDNYYRYPTAHELKRILAHWRRAGIEGEQVFSWVWDGHYLSSRPDLVSVLRQNNE